MQQLNSNSNIPLDEWQRLIRRWPTSRTAGRLHAVRAALLESRLRAGVGTSCLVRDEDGRWHPGEVIGFRGGLAQALAYDDGARFEPGGVVISLDRPLQVPCGDGVLGRVLDGLGRPVDGGGALRGIRFVSVHRRAPEPVRRRPVCERFVTGVRAIDGLLPLGVGQRIGIFAGSGVGKTTLLSMISRHCQADVVVLCLVGERGREVRAALEACRAEQNADRVAAVVATADRSALLRVRAAQTAVAIAESFRDQGKHVVLFLDSLTRLAMAQRELGLLLGEPPTARGYTPSVFQLLGGLLERLGTAERGAVTAICTVLVEGDDLNDPIADATRAILDGHIVLSRELAERGHYPAIDVLQSLSRLADQVGTPEQLRAAAAFREALAVYRDAAELIQIGGYRRGANPMLDRALDLLPAMNAFLRQQPHEAARWENTVAALQAIAARWLQQASS